MRVQVLETCIPKLIERWYPFFSCVLDPALGAVAVIVLQAG
jgi:hypothetical protein